MKIYTKSGDKGETSLYGGKRVSKSSVQIEAYGTIDELNSYVGLMGDYTINADQQGLIRIIQEKLFVIGSHLAADPAKPKLKMPELVDEDIQDLENAIDQMETELEPLTSFILPGGHKEVSMAHVTRSVCRRAERAVIAMLENDKIDSRNIDDTLLAYLNRLSDYLFVLARHMAKKLKVNEIKWTP